MSSNNEEPSYIIHGPLSSHHSPSSNLPTIHHLVFLIPGNPGCVSYYESYLAHLADDLAGDSSPASQRSSDHPTSQRNSDHPISLSVVGISLANFASSPDAAQPFSLQDQIDFTEGAVRKWAEHVGSRRMSHCETDSGAEASAKRGAATPQTLNPERQSVKIYVTLLGHSVGAYIGMEVLRRWKEGCESRNTTTIAMAKATEGTEAGTIDGDLDTGASTTDVDMEIAGFVGLWPTITHIAASPSGQKIGVYFPLPPYSETLHFANFPQWLLRRQHFAGLVACLTYVLALLLPTPALRWLVGRVTAFPPSAVSTTTSFVGRQYSVRQALHMARFEMDEITDDRWADDIWHAGAKGPQLAFLFGDEDHWVARDARDELMHRRRASKERPGANMEIDDMQIPHSFCIRDSQAVAVRTAELVRRMWKHDIK